LGVGRWSSILGLARSLGVGRWALVRVTPGANPNPAGELPLPPSLSFLLLLLLLSLFPFLPSPPLPPPARGDFFSKALIRFGGVGPRRGRWALGVDARLGLARSLGVGRWALVRVTPGASPLTCGNGSGRWASADSTRGSSVFGLGSARLTLQGGEATSG
jgi:hypothetical protein